MNKKTLRKDIRKSFTNSWGRFFSILCLIALGSFALVGLKVTGPHMRVTAEHYFDKLNLADITIISDYGLNDDDIKVIDTASGLEYIEYGYLKDVTIKNTQNSVRIFSKPEHISNYELVSGKMPESQNEIVISNKFNSNYKIGDVIEFNEQEDTLENKVLKHHKFTVVGFVNSSEIISSVSLGESTTGTGNLNAYGVVRPEVFDSDIYMMARLTYKDLKGVDPYSQKYTDSIERHKNELGDLLLGQPERRLSAIKIESQEKIENGYKEIDEAKKKITDTELELKNAEQTLINSETELGENETTLANTKAEVSENETALNNAKTELANNEQELANQQALLVEKQTEYDNGIALLEQKKQEFQSAQSEINANQNEIDVNKKNLEKGKQQYEERIALLEGQITSVEQALANPAIITTEQTELNTKLAELQAGFTQVEQAYNQFLVDTYQPSMIQLQSAQDTLNQKKQELSTAETTIQETEVTLANAKQQLDTGYQQINTATNELGAAKETITVNEQELNKAKTTISEKDKQLEKAKAELASKKNEFQEKSEEFASAKIDGENEISENEEKLQEAENSLNDLKEPIYSLNSRRETPGSDGYKMYYSVSQIIDSLAKVFPIFLYFVAALVTFTTMTRFVDDERMNSGTLKALGYNDRDIIKKFTIYGFIASILGAIIGIILGHTLLPNIVYNAYQTGFTLPHIEAHVDWNITIIALLLAIISAVIPAYVVARKELRNKPTNLLQPKPPVAGSKIFLERIKPLWNRLSFTHKVTARNIFRYKKRMLMTIFGVCGSVALLFTGFGVQRSISGISERQFQEIIHYDLIVAENDSIKHEQQQEIDELLNSITVKQYSPIHYEELSKVAGNSKDKQVIKLLVPENSKTFQEYISLANRQSGKELTLNDGEVIISERFAKLLNVQSGETIMINDSDDKEVKVKISDITEMYMGHFMFMNANTYNKTFNKNYTSNANLLILENDSLEDTETQAMNFMELEGVKGVVQNTALIKQIATIVDSLDNVMKVLIIVAILLAIVILYNLTNINVAERIRELSTIKVLGFYNNEVTMYIYRETILLSLFGVLTGYGFGYLLYQYVLTSVPPDDVMFNPELWIWVFIIPVIIIGITLAVLGLFISKKLYKVDMLEALKSVE